MTRWRTLGLGLVLVVTVGSPGVASAKAKPAHHFKNCTDMHGTYTGGVAKPGAKDHRKNGGHARHLPYLSAALYTANISMDRDGAICSQGGAVAL